MKVLALVMLLPVSVLAQDLRVLSGGAAKSLVDPLAASFPGPGGVERLRELVRADLGVDALGVNARLEDGAIELTIPLLVLRSVSHGEQGRPVESFVAFHRGDRSRFEVEVRRQNRGRRGNPLMVVTDGGARG